MAFGTYIYDMFGDVEGNPFLRRAREEAHDRAIADAEYEARTRSAPRDQGYTDVLGETSPAQGLRWGETPESVFHEIFAPIDEKYESDAAKVRRFQLESLAQRDNVRTLSPGSMLTNPDTGEVIANNPTAPRVVRHKVPLAFGGLLGNEVTESANLTEDEFLSQYDALPQAAKESAIGRLLYSRRQPTTSQTTNREPFGFIGGDGTNAFSNPFRRGFESVAGTNAPTRRRLKFNAQTGQLE